MGIFGLFFAFKLLQNEVLIDMVARTVLTM